MRQEEDQVKWKNPSRRKERYASDDIIQDKAKNEPSYLTVLEVIGDLDTV